ncbi:hypothetical protein TNCV_2802821 [Trichonephila clavipes]|nr:hypothetical protein TNCV_2802821 [Trichonephila clavipes]
MTTHNHLDDFLRWRAVCKLETGQSKKRKVSQGQHRALTSGQDRYLTLSARRHRWTRTPQLSRDLAAVRGRISRQTLYNRLAETVLYARRPVLCVPLTASYKKDRLLWR